MITMNEGQNRFTHFSITPYNESKLDNKVPLYDIFESIDDTILEVCHK